MHSWCYDYARQMYWCARCPVQVPLEVVDAAPKPLWRDIHGRIAGLLNRIVEMPCSVAEPV